MVTKVDSKKNRLKRRARVRGKVYGTAQRPRLAVFRSANHIYAQVINDDLGVTLSIPPDLPESCLISVY